MTECRAISDSWDGRPCGCPECRAIADVRETADEQEQKR